MRKGFQALIVSVGLISGIVSASYADDSVQLFSQFNNRTNKLATYIDEMKFCYDKDLDNKLDDNELQAMVKGQLGEKNCDAPFKKLDSKLITDRTLFDTLSRFLGVSSAQTLRLNLLYRASRDTCR